MAEPFVGEIRLFSMKEAPKGWAMCNGQLLPINGNEMLYVIIGTTFGGDGKTNFALPNLQGRVPMQVDPTLVGTAQGEESHTLTITEIPAHTHFANASTKVSKGEVAANFWGSGTISCYGADKDVSMSANALAATGSSQPHNNMQPYLVLNFCIALTGIYPSRP